MHFLDLPHDIVLLISECLPLPDIGRLIQTCKTLSALSESSNLWSSKLRNITKEYDFPPGSFDPTQDASEGRIRATRPHRFQRCVLSGSLQKKKLSRVRTNISEEFLICIELAPGGRWLVTLSAASISSSRCILRVWDLKAIRNGELSPVVEHLICGSAWKRVGTVSLSADSTGATLNIFVRTNWISIEIFRFDHLNTAKPLGFLRSVDMNGLWMQIGVTQDGPFQFYLKHNANILWIRHWETAEIIAVRISGSVRSEELILSVGLEGIATFNVDAGTISFFGPIDPVPGHQTVEAATSAAVELPLVWQTQIKGCNDTDWDELPTIYPPVNRPFSPLHGPSVLIRYSQVLAYGEFPPHPRADSLVELREYSVPMELPMLWVYGKMASGHIVGLAALDSPPSIDVVTLTTNGETFVQTIEHDKIDTGALDMIFLCTFGGVIGGMNRMAEIWLWQIDGEA